MTEQNSTGWPEKPGVPLNPERDGWHWIKDGLHIMRPRHWSATDRAWRLYQEGAFSTLPHMMERLEYLGSCLTPPEVAAEIAVAERRGIERIAAWHDEQARMLRDPTMWSLPAMPGKIICADRAEVHERSAAAIRALLTESE